MLTRHLLADSAYGTFSDDDIAGLRSEASQREVCGFPKLLVAADEGLQQHARPANDASFDADYTIQSAIHRGARKAFQAAMVQQDHDLDRCHRVCYGGHVAAWGLLLRALRDDVGDTRGSSEACGCFGRSWGEAVTFAQGGTWTGQRQ